MPKTRYRRVANLARDGQILQRARDMALRVLNDDPLLQKSYNRVLVQQLTRLKMNRVNWGMIS